MTGISQVAAQKFTAVPRAVNNARNKYRTASERGTFGAGGKKKEIQPFAVPMPEQEKREVDLDWHLQEVVNQPVTVSVDAQTDEFKSRPGDPSTGLGTVHTAVNSLAWPSNYKLSNYDDEEKSKQNVPIDIIVDDQPVAGNIFQDYVPRKTGIDVGTHINEGDIFSFEKEMEPVVQVIVDKTLEQALMEVEQEAFLDNLSKARDYHLELEKKTMEDWQAQADEEVRRQKKFERTLALARKKYKSDLRMTKRVASHDFAQDMLSNLVTDVLDVQEQRGLFISAADVSISNEFLPWLLDQTLQTVESERDVRQAVDGIYAGAIQESVAEYAEYAPKWVEADRQRLIAEQNARKPKSNSIYFHIDIDGASVQVGPVDVSADDEVSDVEARVYDWLKANCDNIDVAEVMPHGVVLCVDAGSDDAEATPVTDVSDILSSKHAQIVMKARQSEEAPNEADEA